MKKRILWISGAVLLVAGVGIQFIPVERTNPPVEQDIAAPPEVAKILRTSCYDCHSNETTWPWYSRVAPVSWLVSSDVSEGRDRLNFSTWNQFDPEQQRESIKDAVKEAKGGEMPPWFYVLKHPEAKVTPEELAVLKAWAKDQK